MQGNNQTRYSYKGMTLYDYCKGNDELNYNSIRQYVYRQKKKNPELTDEELIEQYMNKKHKGKYTYYYVGIPLKQYCEENNINYQNLIAYMQYHKKDEKFANLDDDEFVEAIMEEYKPFEPKYVYKGVLLIEYCKQNNIPYTSVVSYVKRKLANNSTKSIDDLIDEGIKTINRYGIIYYYNGIPLKDYAKENNLNYSSLRGSIIKRRSNSSKSIQEIVNECVEAYKKFSIKYIYNGTSLRQYCISIGLNYNRIIDKYIKEYQNRKDIDIDNAIREIINYYIANPPINTKYYFNNQSLARFCDSNGYSYSNILRRIRRLQKNNDELNNEQIIEIVIKKYEDRLQIEKINEMFDKLKSGKINDVNEIKDICDFLKIDFENVNDLVSMDFSYNQAINTIWYFSDKKINDDYKIITDKKLKDLFLLVDNLKTSQESDMKNFDVCDLIGIYKSGLYDSRNEILIKQKKYIYHTIYSLCRNYDIKVNSSNFEDFESEIKLYLITVINRVSLNIHGQIVNYMDLTIKGFFREYLKQYKKQNGNISLSNAKYTEDKKTEVKETMIDYIADPNNPFESLEETSFSLTMMQILSDLPQEDVLFIMLKFQENYTDVELANYFEISIEKVKEKEISILSLLKNNIDIQVLKKESKNY